MQEKKDYAEQLNVKAELIREKTKEIAELIEKAKKTSDKQTIEILLKWEISNQKLMEKYQSAEAVNHIDPETVKALKEIPDALKEDHSEQNRGTHEIISEEDLEESMRNPTPPRKKDKKEKKEKKEKKK